MKSNYSILVNTCDKFDDCWDPFFKLFSKYWKDCNAAIFLNTEYKNYSYENLNIHSLKVCEQKKDAHKISWSECLSRALNDIDSDVILYMQEDYFLKDNVKNDLVEKYVQMMHENLKIDCIHLTDQGVAAEKPSNYENLWTVPVQHKDRISCQAALWRKDVLLQYLRSYESGWSFEWWGSKRAAILKHNFYVVDNSWCKKNHFEIIPYIFTGVIGGRWFDEVIPLFEKNNILMDYGIRGFFQPNKSVTFKNRLLSKIKRLPIEIRSYIGLIVLRMNVK
jgi:hypothetical protein